ncbi:MAG TPA: hypothetical protein VD928_02375 [Candidatus Paceibacterota bacterium]|nr:hypothetical protein [Candidatus Paceibacterota bacterium]
MNSTTILYSLIGGITFIAGVAAIWFLFATTPPPAPLPENEIGFGIGDNRVVNVPAEQTPADTTAPATPQVEQKVFKVTDGPVTSATLVQTLHPTTTIARYVLAENGHVLDLVLESPGTVPKAISNTTIPGTAGAVWVENGNAVILQYVDNRVVKTVYLGFPVATVSTSSQQRPVRIQFFPDNIVDITASPDGKSAAYLLATAAGVDGYTARSDSTGSKKLFSAPLSQMLLSWASPSTMLLQTKSSTGIPSIAFSVNAQTGAVVPLLYALGLTAIADRTFSYIVYQTIGSGNLVNSYVRDVKTGKDVKLSFNPLPPKCIWGPKTASSLYCASPLEYTPPNYLELWYKGAASMSDALFFFNVSSGESEIITAPGGEEGGVLSDILELTVSPDEKYLLFTKKGDRSLWAMRLSAQATTTPTTP